MRTYIYLFIYFCFCIYQLNELRMENGEWRMESEKWRIKNRNCDFSRSQNKVRLKSYFRIFRNLKYISFEMGFGIKAKSSPNIIRLRKV